VVGHAEDIITSNYETRLHNDRVNNRSRHTHRGNYTNSTERTYQMTTKVNEFYTFIGNKGGGPYRPRVDKEWCDGCNHWKLKDKPCEVCEARKGVK
jgi:hypothetical protein